jgi:hypothetical protein
MAISVDNEGEPSISLDAAQQQWSKFRNFMSSVWRSTTRRVLGLGFHSPDRVCGVPPAFGEPPGWWSAAQLPTTGGKTSGEPFSLISCCPLMIAVQALATKCSASLHRMARYPILSTPPRTVRVKTPAIRIQPFRGDAEQPLVYQAAFAVSPHHTPISSERTCGRDGGGRMDWP